jgi:hypothetical protein
MPSDTHAAEKFNHWPLVELAFHIQKGHATCPSVIDMNVATLLTADLHPMGEAEIWSCKHISTSLTARIPIIMYADGCPKEEQPSPPNNQNSSATSPHMGTLCP